MIRLDVERLACAVEARNISMLSELAKRVAAAAGDDGLLQVADTAMELQKSATGNGDPEQITRLTDELLKLCRSNQLPPSAAA